MGGPDQRPALDGFSLFLPFPHRVAVLLVAGFWAWGFNLQYLLKANIDVPALIRYPPRHSPNQRSHHASAYRLATVLTIPLVLTILIFWVTTHGSADRVESLDFIPQSYFFISPIILLLPMNIFSRSGRRRFLVSLSRVVVGGLADAQHGKFGDILLADALTSYAKVLGDLFVTFCMFFSPDVTSTSKPNRSCGTDYIVPLIIAAPSVMRLRQCLIEYVRARRAGARNGRGQHLANALKYATIFPVILFAAKLRHYNPQTFYGYSEMSLSRFLTFFSLINSGFSFYWDVSKDWDLTLLSPSRINPEYPYGLRRHRFFTDRQYYLAIAIDFVIRFSWFSNFIPWLRWLTELESGLFILMALEVARRWMWVLLRAEAEWVRNDRGPDVGDVLLGEIGSKLDAD